MNVNRGFAKAIRQFNHLGVGGVRGWQPTDYFYQSHHWYRVEEMQANESFRLIYASPYLSGIWLGGKKWRYVCDELSMRSAMLIPPWRV